MILISEVATRVQKFLSTKDVEKFKVFVRLNFVLDVFIFVSDTELGETLYDDFIKSLENEGILDANLYKINFNIISSDELSDPYYASIVKDEVCNIDFGQRFSLNTLLSNVDNTIFKRDELPPIITFYSYKGGMGRTTTLMAYALDLALNQKKRVVVIDCDLEAPGYLNFFDLSKHEELLNAKVNGLVEFMCDIQFLKDTSNLDINKYAINASIKNHNPLYRDMENMDKLWIVPAGNLNEVFSVQKQTPGTRGYLEGLSRINVSNTKMQLFSFNLLVKKIKEAYNPEVILIDSRTGFNDIFGTAAFYLSTCVVGFFGFSKQTLPGVTNLLKEYYDERNSFKLQLVCSILPENADETWINTRKSEIDNLIDNMSSEEKDRPSLLSLRRQKILESLGTEDGQSDQKFIDIVMKKMNFDYTSLFAKLDSTLPKNDALIMQECEDEKQNSNIPAIDLRNVVLKHLKEILPNVKKFAEDSSIDEKYFFYRNCMKELFNPKKFLIQGYKGTGKTFLYTALTETKISPKIRNWAKDIPFEEWPKDEKPDYFINILPTKDGKAGNFFDDINYGLITDYKFYFNRFWQIYTWIQILSSNDDFEEIRATSELTEYIKPLSGSEAIIKIEELINRKDTLVVIEKDLKKLNQFLQNDPYNRKVFIMYDRLDTCFNPIKWGKSISPLINYWRNNHLAYENIIPKIFIRTDLFKQIEGTNTDRLSENIVSLEWTLGEVFGYLFKLIFQNKEAKDAYWSILRKMYPDGRMDQYIKNRNREFDLFPFNQFKNVLNDSDAKSDMSPVISAFFGKYVSIHQARLGSPWDYFKKELSNADKNSISLRPFINTLNSNAIDLALKNSTRYVRVIIDPQIYASKEVRDKATQSYFDDLTAENFSKGLVKFKDVIRTAGGEQFRFKSLDETQFEQLVTATFNRIQDEGGDEAITNARDLKNLIFANGIMAEKITTKGRFYTFASIYWYSWGLANSVLENEDAMEKKRNQENIRFKGRDSLVTAGNETLQGELHFNEKNKPVVTIDNGFSYEARGNIYFTFSRETIRDGIMVSFKVGSEPDKRNPEKDFYIAYDIKRI